MNRALAVLAFFLAAVSVSAQGFYPMEMGDLRREGRSLAPSSLKNPLEIQWQTQPCDDFGWPDGGPVVLADRVIHAFDKGVRCYDRVTGVKLWTWPTGPQLQLYSTPTYDPDRNLLYVGTVQGDTLALDPATGQVKWFYGHDPAVAFSDWDTWQYSSPMYAEGKLFVGTGGLGFRCIDPTTRATVWNLDFSAYLGKPYRSGTCTPAYDAGKIYLSTHDGDLFCVNAADGTVIWHNVQPGWHSNAVLVTDNYVVIGLYHGVVRCLNKNSGAQVWENTETGVTMGNMAICGNVLIVPGDSWVVWALDINSGRKVWTTRLTGNFARSSPFVVCGKVYISACHGDFYGLDGQSGKIEWRYFHGADQSFVEWAEADGKLFVCNKAEVMYCFAPVTPGNPAQCSCNLDGDWTPAPTPTFTPTYTLTATPTGTPQGSCAGRVCRASVNGSADFYFDPANTAPPNDMGGKDWKDPAYLEGGAWKPAVEIQNPPGEWIVPCSLSGVNHAWIGTSADGLPPTLADAYFRTGFELPAGVTVFHPTLILSGDNLLEAWLNGHYLGKFEGPYIGDSHLYDHCVTVTVDPAFLQAGPNALAFRVMNQMTFLGLTYEFCADFQAPCLQPTATPTWTPTLTPSPTWTPTMTWTPTATLSSTPSETFTETPTFTQTPTFTPTLTPTLTSTPTETLTPTVTFTPTQTATPKPHDGPCQPRAYPNPSDGGPIRFDVVGGPYNKVEFKVYSVAARCLHQEDRTIRSANDETFQWNCGDDQGHPVGNGLYLAVFKCQRGEKAETHIAKVMVLR